MNQFDLPPISLRGEILGLLTTIGEEEHRAVLPPIGIMAMLNLTGPPLGPKEKPYVEFLLDQMFEKGLVGCLPAPNIASAKGYPIRQAAEKALEAGAVLLLRPLAPEFQPKPRTKIKLHKL